ncbi:hypothetical protein [Streptomyces sp. NPDC051921]|uniref:hypothetical protein n=1 Tax=Streptomyces sp. NPDC051921 TaxID=3155806 RepID=UPI00342DB29B
MKHRITTDRTIWATLASAAVVAAATGCGPTTTDAGAKDTKATSPSPAKPKDAFDSLTGSQISSKALAALKSASSMRVSGTVPADDKTNQSMQVNVAMDTQGSCRGSLTLPGTVSLELLRKGKGAFYIKGNEKFWRAMLTELAKDGEGLTRKQANAAVDMLKSRWVKADEKSAKDLTATNFCDMDKLQDLGGHSDVTRGADVVVAGRPVAVIYDREDWRVTTVHVAKTGKPYPVQITTTDSSSAAPDTLVKFSEFNKPVDTTLPPADQIIDANNLG